MVRYSFLVRLSHPLLHAGLSRRILDHLIGPREELRRKCQTDLFRSLQVDHKLKLRGLLHRQVSRFGTFQDFVDVDSRASISVSEVPPVGHETALIDKLLFWV